MHHRHAQRRRDGLRRGGGYRRGGRRCGGACGGRCCGRVRLRAGGVLRLRGRSGRGALAQLAPRGLTCPGAGVDLAHHAQPLLGLGQRGEVAHVQTKALAPFLEAPADEEGETLELRQIRLRERHGRRRRAQVEHERPRACGRRGRIPGFRARASVGSEVGCCCHNFPGHEITRRPRPRRIGAEFLQRGRRCSLAAGAIVAAPPS